MDIGSFAAGVAQGASEDISRRRDSALAMKMQSAALELQHQQRMSEAEAATKRATAQAKDLAVFQAKLEAEKRPLIAKEMREEAMVPNEEFNHITGQVSNFIGAITTGNTPDSLDFSNVKSPQGQALATQMFQHAMQTAHSMGLIPVRGVDANGKNTVTFFGKRNGQQVGEPIEVGDTPRKAGMLADARKSYFEMKQYTDEIRRTITGFIKADNGLSALAQRGTLTINQIAQANPRAAAYFKQLYLESATLDKRMIGSVKTGGKTLIENTVEALPGMGDTFPVAMEKLDGLMKKHVVPSVKGAYDAWHEPYDKDIPELVPIKQVLDVGQEQGPSRAEQIRLFMEAKKNKKGK